MTLLEKKAALLAELSRRQGAQDRLVWLVAQARGQASLDAGLKTEAHRLQGCLSKLWIVAEFSEGRCHFRCDSDSQIVKALAGLLCEFYTGRAPAEILSVDPAFLAELGLNQHLTANRRNALSRVWERIRSFAQASLESEDRHPSFHAPLRCP